MRPVAGRWQVSVCLIGVDSLRKLTVSGAGARYRRAPAPFLAIMLGSGGPAGNRTGLTRPITPTNPAKQRPTTPPHDQQRFPPEEEPHPSVIVHSPPRAPHDQQRVVPQVNPHPTRGAAPAPLYRGALTGTGLKI